MVVNELSTAYLTLTFTDEDGAAAAPLSVAYWIHDDKTGRLLRDETAVTPAASVTITLAPADNVLVTATTQTVEVRIVTVIAAYGIADQVTEELSYEVRALRFVPEPA